MKSLGFQINVENKIELEYDLRVKMPTIGQKP